MAHQQWQPPAVIDVRVAQDDAIEPTRIERQLGVERMALGPMTLEQSGVEQKAAPAASSRCIEPVT